MSIERKHIKGYWKSKGKIVDRKASGKIEKWMKAHGFSTAPGSMAMFLHSPVHHSARVAAVKAFGLGKKTAKTTKAR